MCAQSQALGTRTNFQLDILIVVFLQYTHKFQMVFEELAKR